MIIDSYEQLAEDHARLFPQPASRVLTSEQVVATDTCKAADTDFIEFSEEDIRSLQAA